MQIAPSILAADFGHLADEIRLIETGGADLVHVDVMDGHFVPNLTMGVPVVSALRRLTALPLDVHLMIEEPDRYLEAFVSAGASMISVHAEVCRHLHRTLSRIRELGARASVAVNPATPLATVADAAHLIDNLLVMCVNPGFTGQTFIPESTARVAAARALLTSRGLSASIEVDGGIGPDNAALVVGAGATILVAGASIFHQADRPQAVRDLRAAALGT
ncbi:MAG: ribulose-phosphate 3-epimerase [Vicinamibacterales bacterium]